MRRIALILAGLVLLASIVVSARTLAQRDEADAVDVESVASDGRRAATKGSRSESQEPGLRPVSGTYEYAGSGRESVDTLGGSEHVMPRRIPVRVELGTGCRWKLSIFYVKQHVEHREYCTNDTGVHDVRFQRQIEFFGVTEKARFECVRPALRWQRGASAGSSWTYRCEGDGRRGEYRVTYTGEEAIRVAGARVRAHRVHVQTTLSGATEGTDSSEYWYAASGLPLRWTTRLDVRTESALGRTRLRERTKYTLVNTTPHGS